MSLKRFGLWRLYRKFNSFLASDRSSESLRSDSCEYIFKNSWFCFLWHLLWCNENVHSYLLRLLIWAYVALAFRLQSFVDFPTKSICLVVMKFCLVLSVLLLSKPTSWVCLATLGALKTTDYLWLHLQGFIFLVTKPATLKKPALPFKYECSTFTFFVL